MNTCICSNCKNLKTIIDEIKGDEEGIIEECAFGFPDESCSECEVEGCERTCEHYEAETTEDTLITALCCTCGKELKIDANNAEAGDVYCPMCYLSRQ